MSATLPGLCVLLGVADEPPVGSCLSGECFRAPAWGPVGAAGIESFLPARAACCCGPLLLPVPAPSSDDAACTCWCSWCSCVSSAPWSPFGPAPVAVAVPLGPLGVVALALSLAATELARACASCCSSSSSGSCSSSSFDLSAAHSDMAARATRVCHCSMLNKSLESVLDANVNVNANESVK